MTDEPTEDHLLGEKLGHTAEGSDAACRVLRSMARWKMPMSAADISTLTGLSPRVVGLALQGLQERNRVEKTGITKGQRWTLVNSNVAATAENAS